MGKKTTPPRGTGTGTATTPRAVSSRSSTNGKGHSAPPAKAARRAAAPAAAATAAVAKAAPPSKPRSSAREPRASNTATASSGRSPSSSPSPSRRNGRARSINAEQIAIRAYFISERRQCHGLPGDPATDWITAERELIAETRPA